MNIEAAEGFGCALCERGIPITYVQNSTGRVLGLCSGCTTRSTGLGAEWFEAHHSGYADHLSVALARAHDAQIISEPTLRAPP